MEFFEKKPIRKRVLIPLTLTFLVLLLVFLFSSYSIRKSAVGHAIDHRSAGVNALFVELQKQRISLMAAMLQYLSKDAALQDAIIRNDRNILLHVAHPLFEELKNQYGLTHLYFHEKNGKNFLRVHQPQNFGDQIERLSLKNARKTKQLSYGLELGPFGTYSLRVVIPWYGPDKQLIGYLELGEEIDQIIKLLSEITGVDFVVSVYKDHLTRDAWERGMKMLDRYADWDLLATRVLTNQTLNSIPHAVEKEIFWDFQDEDHYHFVETEAQKSYWIKAFPLKDSGGEHVGEFVMLLDTSKERKAYIMFLLKIGIFSAVICSALFTFSYRTLGRMDRALSVTKSNLYDQIDNAVGLNSQLKTEIMERSRAEEELKSLNATLEERISDRTRKLESLNSEIEGQRLELEKAYEDLKANQMTILHQDKMASIGQLAAGVAHDINNPIGFVTNNLGELDRYIKDLRQFLELQGGMIEELKPDADQIKLISEKRSELQVDEMVDDLDDIIQESLEGTQRVSKIVQNLRNFSRLDEDDYELADLHECLDSTINISGNELRYKAEVIRDYGDIPEIHCYPGQLNQVFMNLLINAAQSMQNYGEIAISTWSQAGSVFVKFVDTGVGIPESVQNRIFEPFFTTKEVGTGTGLGLSITYDIIQKHEGDIWVESEVGKGTTFVIRLPIRQPDIV